MASAGLTAFDTWVDGLSLSALRKRRLKVVGEKLYLAVYHELIDLLEAVGDADALLNPGDAVRQVKFKAWYADARADEAMLHHIIIDRLEGNH